MASEITVTNFEHSCSEIICDGDIIESYPTGIKKVRKTILKIDGKTVFMGSLADAQKFAKKIRIEWP